MRVKCDARKGLARIVIRLRGVARMIVRIKRSGSMDIGRRTSQLNFEHPSRANPLGGKFFYLRMVIPFLIQNLARYSSSSALRVASNALERPSYNTLTEKESFWHSLILRNPSMQDLSGPKNFM